MIPVVPVPSPPPEDFLERMRAADEALLGPPNLEAARRRATAIETAAGLARDLLNDYETLTPEPIPTNVRAAAHILVAALKEA